MQLITIHVVYLKQQPQCLAECMYVSVKNDGDLSTQLSKKQRQISDGDYSIIPK